MKRYDPLVAPSPQEWLALGEAERLLLVESFHGNAQIRIPNARVHAVLHTVVESQLAEGLAPVVDALSRLRREGLDRHDSIHAIGSVLISHLRDLVSGTKAPSDAMTAYYAELATLTAEGWGAS
jgi:hypothetical protein